VIVSKANLYVMLLFIKKVYRIGGINMYYCTNYNSPVGMLTLAADEGNNLVGLWMEGQKYFKDTIPTKLVQNNELEIFKMAKNWLDEYFNGSNPSASTLPLKPIGGSFRQEVWKILTKYRMERQSITKI